MPTVEIDGQSVEVAEGTTIFRACEQMGISLPHYCYHPALSIAGNCRICMVEVNGRTMISCATVCAEGMKIHTQSDLAKWARRQVMEFLLLNHPLDCPVCDQAGDCNLQNFYLTFARHKSRMPQELKVHKEKRKPVSSNIMLDQERCILCSRCVRFVEEVTGTFELGIFQRGDHAVLDVLPGEEVQNAYSGCLVDVCPVGALLDREYRYSISSWFLTRSPSICPHCERGCSIEVHHNETHYPRRKERVFRIKPRLNPEVNGYWICDEGRYRYRELDEERFTEVQKRAAGELKPYTWKEALADLPPLFRTGRGKMLLSTFLTNEELFLAKELAAKGKLEIGCFTLDDSSFGDDLLRRPNRTPNKKMAEWLQIPLVDPHCFLEGASPAFVFHPHLLPEFRFPEQTIFFATHTSPHLAQGELLLPVTPYAEKEGSFTNFEGRVQDFSRALTPLGQAKPEWEILRDCYLLLDFPLKEITFSSLHQRVVQALAERGSL